MSTTATATTATAATSASITVSMNSRSAMSARSTLSDRSALSAVARSRCSVSWLKRAGTMTYCDCGTRGRRNAGDAGAGLDGRLAAKTGLRRLRPGTPAVLDGRADAGPLTLGGRGVDPRLACGGLQEYARPTRPPFEPSAHRARHGPRRRSSCVRHWASDHLITSLHALVSPAQGLGILYTI